MSFRDDGEGETGATECDEEGVDSCAICLGDLRDDHTTSLSGCGHVFHSACIVHALQHNRSCPLCRFQPSTSHNSDTSGDDDEAEYEEALAEWTSRRARAIRSSLMRVNYGSASTPATTAARQYRTLNEALRHTRSKFREVDREAHQRRRMLNSEIEKVVKNHRRETQALRRRWWMCRGRLENLASQVRQAGDVLASEAGFTTPSP